MIHQPRLDRRAIVRGIGAAVALPWLEAMGPRMSFGGESANSRPPLRMAMLYVPNGKNMADWTPTFEGAGYDLPVILEPLAEHRDDLLVLTGLTADKARPHGDGGGDHARAMAAFLTGVQPRKTDGTDIRSGTSVDQIAATRMGDVTRLPSLEIGCEAGAMAGNCDSGYSCVYSSTMSWRSATQPLPKEVNPRLVFERLFGAGGDSDRQRRDAVRKSILDVVREDSADLSRKLGAHDRRKLDEYFSAVRDIEQRIERASRLPEVPQPDFPAPGEPPEKHDEYLRLMCDLMVLAFQADLTRVATCVFANEGSNRPYPFIGVAEGHHDLSHHGGDAAKKGKIRDINRFHTTQLAYFLKRMKEVREGDSTLLDSAMIAYGSGNSDGNAHNHDDLPILLAGRAGGRLKPGRHVRYAKETPLNNLWLAMLERFDVKMEQFGDATGALTGLS